MSSEEHSDDQGEDQRARWDIKYEQGLPSLTEPDPFFISAYERFVTPSIPKPGAALDLAGGLGRHALWLASRQWRGNPGGAFPGGVGKTPPPPPAGTIICHPFSAREPPPQIYIHT